MARFEVRDEFDPSGFHSGPGSRYYVHDNRGEYQSRRTFRLKRDAQRYAAKLEKQATKKNAGLFSKRKTKKVRGQGSDAYIKVLSGRARETKARKKAARSNPKEVYDEAGKLLGKFKTKAAHLVARAVGGTVGKPRRNPATVELPVGKLVRVMVLRRPDGRMDIFKAR